MSEQVKIQVLFTEKTEYGDFTDALYFTESEFLSMTREKIDALKQERLNNWILSIQAGNNGQ